MARPGVQAVLVAIAHVATVLVVIVPVPTVLVAIDATPIEAAANAVPAARVVAGIRDARVLSRRFALRTNRSMTARRFPTTSARAISIAVSGINCGRCRRSWPIASPSI